MKLFELQQNKRIEWYRPEIGWWLDNDPVRFYHGTHERNLQNILESGIQASETGYVSLALEPYTAHGYAAMSGAGGELDFRKAGANVVNTPHDKRVVIIVDLPQAYFLPKMAPARGAIEKTRDRLKDKTKYENWQSSDIEYYSQLEIRLPNNVPPKYITGWTKRY